MFDLKIPLAIACLAILPTSPAQAAAVYTGNTIATNSFAAPTLDKGTGNTPTTYVATGTGGSATSVSHGANGGSVDSTAQSNAYSPAMPDLNQAGARTTITYRVDIVTLVPSAPLNGMIPIRIASNGSVTGQDLGGTAGGSAYVDATAQFVVARNNGQVVVNQSIETMGYDTKTFVFDEVLDFLPTDYLTVTLEAYAGAGGGGYLDAGHAHAFVDPTFTIDPAFASLYALVGIPGADAVTPPGDPGNGNPGNGVPEPSTIALLCLGLLATASVGRGRKRRSLARASVASRTARRVVDALAASPRRRTLALSA